MSENKRIEQQGWCSFPARPESYSQILNTIVTAARLAGVSEQLQMKLELGLEEAVVNIIKHAYGEEPGLIWLRTGSDNGKFVLEIADYGKPFNPLKQQQQQPKDMSIEERQPGGYGVQFMKWIFDELDYKYSIFNGKKANRLMLILKIK